MSGFKTDGTVDLQDLRVKLYDLLGQRYSAVSPSPGAMMLLQTADMLSSPNGEFHCQGRIRGVGFNGKRFSVQEVCADRDDPATPGFDGLIISMSHALPIYGRTLVMPNRGEASPRHIDGMKRVAFPPPGGDTRIEAYADNQVEGRSLVSMNFTRALIELSAALKAEAASVAFAGRQMHVVLPTGERARFSKATSFYKHDVASVQIIDEITRVFDVIGRIDVLQACADRHYPDAQHKARADYYVARRQSIAPMVDAAMTAGIVTDSRRAKYLTHEAAMIDPALSGMVMSNA